LLFRGVESNSWCGIPDSCESSSAAETCTGSKKGYSCCKSCETVYTDADGAW